MKGIPTRACPGCKRNIPGRTARCFYCGSLMDAPEPRPPRPCPRCSREMEEIVTNWVAIDRCGGCKGEFYDRGEMDGSLKLDDKGLKWLSENVMPHLTLAGSRKLAAIDCPGCAAEMRPFVVRVSPEFEIDVCPKCKGTWLDEGEARSLQRAIADGLLPVVALPKVHGRMTPWTGSWNDSVQAATSWTLGELALEIAIEVAANAVSEGSG